MIKAMDKTQMERVRELAEREREAKRDIYYAQSKHRDAQMELIQAIIATGDEGLILNCLEVRMSRLRAQL